MPLCAQNQFHAFYVTFFFCPIWRSISFRMNMHVTKRLNVIRNQTKTYNVGTSIFKCKMQFECMSHSNGRRHSRRWMNMEFNVILVILYRHLSQMVIIHQAFCGAFIKMEFVQRCNSHNRKIRRTLSWLAIWQYTKENGNGLIGFIQIKTIALRCLVFDVFSLILSFSSSLFLCVFVILLRSMRIHSCLRPIDHQVFDMSLRWKNNILLTRQFPFILFCWNQNVYITFKTHFRQLILPFLNWLPSQIQMQGFFLYNLKMNVCEAFCWFEKYNDYIKRLFILTDCWMWGLP